MRPRRRSRVRHIDTALTFLSVRAAPALCVLWLASRPGRREGLLATLARWQARRGI